MLLFPCKQSIKSSHSADVTLERLSVKAGLEKFNTLEETELTFLLIDGFSMLSFSSAVDVLRIANNLSDTPVFRYQVVTLSNQPVKASNGFAIMPSEELDSLKQQTILVVIAGTGAKVDDHSEAIKIIRYARRNNCTIWGLSSGVVVLAQAGQLQGRTIAAHWADAPYFREHYPDITVSQSLFEFDKNLATCAGGGAAADLMLHALIGAKLGREKKEEIASVMVLDTVRDGRLQQMTPLDIQYATSQPTVCNVISEMNNNIFTPLKISELAEEQNISQRQLERLFKTHVGLSPARVYLNLRLEKARQEVLQARRPMSEIALDYGFSMSNFARIYARIFGVSPTADRASKQA
jgi:transcriptional regulator GlxA family with amidase domain